MMCPKYQLKINDEIFAEGEYPSEPAARHMLGRSAFHALQRHCISILRVSTLHLHLSTLS